MESSGKRPRYEEWIRLSDGFRRTEVNVICPIMKAENSIRVLYRLQEEMLTNAIRHAGNSVGLTLEDIQFASQASSRSTDSNLFVKFENPLPNDENLCSKFKESLEKKLAGTTVKNILVEKVQDTRRTVPQPLISEYDFEMYKLKLCLRELNDMRAESPERLDLMIQSENIESYLEELSNSYTKFAVLSQNGKGKSYILNLLMLMTADNAEEYSENNRNLKMPKDFPDNLLMKNLKDTDLQNLPLVVKQFLNGLKDNKKDFKNPKERKCHKLQNAMVKAFPKNIQETDFKRFMQPICHQLQDASNVEKSLNSFSGISEYFTNKKRLEIEPYFLSQKDTGRSYESTTKCIIHLRYGTLYEMKVKFFDKSELQRQLYELVTMEEDSQLCADEYEDAKEKAMECLSERYEILTGQSFSETIKDELGSPDDISLSPEVLQFAGKTELYFGQGKNPTHDRLALQSVLRGLSNPQEDDEAEEESYKKRIAAVKKIVVYLPCKILHGGKEILEMPGTDDSDPIATAFIADALNMVDAVILLTEYSFKLCEKEVKAMLSKSRFLQHFKEHPGDHLVMLFAYPEKNSKWQYASSDEEAIKSLEKQRKRDVELKEIRKILKMGETSRDLEERIITSYILPVLHTSILSMKDKPDHEVVSSYEDLFLKYTGVQNLMMNLDALALTRQKPILEQVRNELSNFHDEVNGVISAEDAKAIVMSLSTRSIKNLIEPEIGNRFSALEKTLNETMERMLAEDIASLIKTKLEALVPQAIARWDKQEHRVRSIAVFNPYFCGKNPRYRVSLYLILFEDLENHKIEIFEKILQTIKKILQDYKKKAIQQYAKELNTILRNLDRPASITSEVVEKAIGDQLDDTLNWYHGKKKRPFNEKSLEKCMDDSQKDSLSEVILIPNFIKCDVEKAKTETRKNIRNCLLKVEEYFIGYLLNLHDARFRSLTNKLRMPNNTPKIWQQLIKHLKSLTRDAGAEKYKEKINSLLTMTSISSSLSLLKTDSINEFSRSEKKRRKESVNASYI
ncbi:uncharacterized protein RB166_001657 [Leptodactylus fuscus]|uniref:uncharacterized protein LOC142183515 n=1 Tax=Leptodactylus fuscus TaxID=238119 RepID=UPI003F4E9371